MTWIILCAVLLLAYSNGANDNVKGVATLIGSGTTSYRKALAWATVTTLAGSILALVLAQGLVDTFKGKGLVPDALTGDPAFRLAVAVGAALTILLATRLGLPVSTTHALTGGLIGAGVLATGGQVNGSALLTSFVGPLLLSPILSLLLTAGLYPLLHGLKRHLAHPGRPWNRWVKPPVPIVAEGIEGMGDQARTSLHYLSAGAVGFARGLNDTPKMVALLLVTPLLPTNLGLAGVVVAMALGGVLQARRVGETLSYRITPLRPGQGLTANLVTSLLVTLASRLGLPVSTTHVSVGALFGIGLVSGTARKGVIATILLAWVTTLPMGAALAGLTYWMIG